MLQDYRKAAITSKLRATLALLEKMTLAHATIQPEDVRAVLAEGVSKEGIEEALEVAFLFNIYDRLADTMGWDVPAHASGFYQVSAKRLLQAGYR